MKIGIDISQIAYEGTGVGNLTRKLVENLILLDTDNEYILFYSSLRRNFNFQISNFQLTPNAKVKEFKFPPIFLDFLWNKLHIFPIEWLIGKVDVFLSSDWTQPPTKAKKATILYDLIVYKYPKETHDQFKFDFKRLRIIPNIVASQKRRLHWVKKECDTIICISEATKKDAMEVLGISENKLKVVYPGF